MSSPRAPSRHAAGAFQSSLAAALVAALVAACGGGGSDAPVVASPAGGYGALTAEQAIVRFLDAAQSEDYEEMWTVFGTADGAAIEEFGVREVEPRMVVLSRLLRHRDYDLRAANLAGLGPDRTRYEVRMVGTRKGEVTVPFITARDETGRWYVEQLEASKLSGD